MEAPTIGVVIERLDNLKTTSEQRHLDLKSDIGEVKKDTGATNGRVLALEGRAVDDQIYKGKVQMILYLFGGLLTFLFLGIIAPVVVIYVQSKFFH